ncbi:MAG: hypothetical protein V1733_10655, partial [bacterium]
QRIVQRKSETDAVSFDTFLHNEERESVSSDPSVQNLKACIEEADFMFLNNGTMQDLFSQIDDVLFTFVL